MNGNNENNDGLPVITPMKLPRISEKSNEDGLLSPVESLESTGSQLVLDNNSVFDVYAQEETRCGSFVRIMSEKKHVPTIFIILGLGYTACGFVLSFYWKFLCPILAAVMFTACFYFTLMWWILPCVEGKKHVTVENEEGGEEEEAKEEEV